MKITFITTALNLFGSIRELIENANRLVDYGHNVTIYSDLKKYPFSNWLPCKAKLKQLGRIAKTDVLIMMDSPFDYHMRHFENAKAKFKTFIMMGFDHNGFKPEVGNKLYNYEGSNTEKNLMQIFNKYEICADGDWQLDYLQKFGIKTGVSIGGINLDMFRDLGLKRNIQLGWSGDKRKRKAAHIVNNAIKQTPFSSLFYAGTTDQNELIKLYNSFDLFLDNHLRGGWINPVLESMACGCVPICRNIPALQEFAINKETAIVLDNPDEKDFVKAIKETIGDGKLKKELRDNAKKHIQQFSYDIVTKKLENYLLSKI